MSLISLLQRWHILPAFTRSDIEDADDEDVMRSAVRHDFARKAAERVSELNHQANGSLRDAVRRVRSSSVFADFERSVRSDR